MNEWLEQAPRSCYLSPEGGERRLEEELQQAGVHFKRYGRLILASSPAPRSCYWAQNIWQTPVVESISSIQQAVKRLRSLQKYWALWPVAAVRRSILIQESLPKVKNTPIEFPAPIAPQHPIGSWCLLDEQTLLYSCMCSSSKAHGEWLFAPPKPHQGLIPPSLAYLKLWEAFSRLQRHPLANERCLEIGVSPGSWTWGLSQLGTQVIAVDKAPLAEGIAQLPGVQFCQGDAFQYSPARVGSVDWILSDVICYPEKLLKFLLPWVQSGLCRYFVCTIKFQGAPKQDVIKQFASIPGSQIFHLFHNKNELTWTLGFPPQTPSSTF